MKIGKLRISNGALDEVGGSIVLRGVIEPASYGAIQIDRYQREEGSTSDLAKMVAAIKAGDQLPDIEIGIRGNSYVERDGVFIIDHNAFAVDGQQRLAAARRVYMENPDANIRLGALLHFGSNEAWERDRFKVLNLLRRKVSPNVLLRNEVESPVAQALISMSATDKEFPLKGKVSWGQKMGRGELVTALTLLKTMGVLHSHHTPGMNTNLELVLAAADKSMALIGPIVWRANARVFFGVIDQAFGLSAIAYRDLSPQIKGGFLRALAKIFADHKNFWEANRLVVDRQDRDKLRQFPIRDPGIISLVNGNGQVNALLYNQIVQHLNRGRRKNRLVKWNGQQADGLLDTGTLDPASDDEEHSQED